MLYVVALTAVNVDTCKRTKIKWSLAVWEIWTYIISDYISTSVVFVPSTFILRMQSAFRILRTTRCAVQGGKKPKNISAVVGSLETFENAAFSHFPICRFSRFCKCLKTLLFDALGSAKILIAALLLRSRIKAV